MKEEISKQRAIAQTPRGSRARRKVRAAHRGSRAAGLCDERNGAPPGDALSRPNCAEKLWSAASTGRSHRWGSRWRRLALPFWRWKSSEIWRFRSRSGSRRKFGGSVLVLVPGAGDGVCGRKCGCDGERVGVEVRVYAMPRGPALNIHNPWATSWLLDAYARISEPPRPEAAPPGRGLWPKAAFGPSTDSTMTHRGQRYAGAGAGRPQWRVGPLLAPHVRVPPGASPPGTHRVRPGHAPKMAERNANDDHDPGTPREDATTRAGDLRS